MQLSVDCAHHYPSGFNLQVQFTAGTSVTALFGASGSGKTTTLNLIAGHLRPASGRICLGEQVLVDSSAGVFLPPDQRRIGIVFQDHRLFPHLTVRRNLEYGLRRRPLRQIDLAKVVQVLELETLLDRPPATLSGGQQQRVALGRAILRGPELLLLDEPLAALDDALKHRVLVYLELRNRDVADPDAVCQPRSGRCAPAGGNGCRAGTWPSRCFGPHGHDA